MTFKQLLFAIFCFSICYSVSAQDGRYYGIKGGLTIGTQQWNSFDRDPLIGYHGILSVENYAAEGEFALFGQLGYHLKGSAIRQSLFGNPFNPGLTTAPPRNFAFHNLSLSLGAKQNVKQLGKGQVYYLFGVRLDFTVDTNLEQYDRFVERNPNFAGIYPLNVYYTPQTLLGVRRINYGFIAGGGLTIPFSEYIDGLIEFSVNPDFSLQYEQPQIPNILDPISGQTRSIPSRKIRNLTFEITVGARFLQKIEYID